MLIKLIALYLAIAVAAVPTFTLDFDESPSTRYNELFLHFNSTLLEMETLFLHSVAPKYREVFQQREEWF